MLQLQVHPTSEGSINKKQQIQQQKGAKQEALQIQHLRINLKIQNPGKNKMKVCAKNSTHPSYSHKISKLNKKPECGRLKQHQPEPMMD